MEFEMNPYIVYVKINCHEYITEINSSAFLSDLNNWIEIDQGYSDKYHHAQNNYLSNSLITENGAFRYKLINNKVFECTAEEIAAQEEANKPIEQPTQNDIFEA